jgi:hypothetical protein
MAPLFGEKPGSLTRLRWLDIAAFQATPLIQDPFDYLIVPGFIRPEARPIIHDAYPRIESPGSFPVQQLSFGVAFQDLLEGLQGPEMRQAVEEKFSIVLSGKPTMITVRGRCGPRDGQIHTDTKSKLITVLIYMNPQWEHSGGKLRLLRSADDIEDVVAEVPPIEGTLLAFRRSDNSWHGHKPFLGPRRVIQLNWVDSHLTARRELLRHRLSASLKKFFSLFRASEGRLARESTDKAA